MRALCSSGRDGSPMCIRSIGSCFHRCLEAWSDSAIDYRDRAHLAATVEAFSIRDGAPSLIMRVAVVGASGNIGTSVLSALTADPAVDEVIAIARRRAPKLAPGVSWRARDISVDDLGGDFDRSEERRVGKE